ncbi:MAG TPA: GTPase domain-containing protein [Burkholderiaceae bacterium]|nr:GTPase domain-containing protein [Burkholderiaceae bacterium]
MTAAGDAVIVDLVLVSHTNSGKTTLARTLLGRDIGTIRDAPHVTELAEVHRLLDTPAGDELRLWDTPGFGDSARLVKRLRLADNPIGWLLREVWDRHRDRPFWCSQQAVRAARGSADVVLYLVNAAERPGDAGYLAAEMQVLRWIGKPVLALLNQLGPPRPDAEDLAEQELWRSHLASHGLDCKVLTLDAFARCWVQEGALLDAVGQGLDEAKRTGFDRLRGAWTARNLVRFDKSMGLLAEQLAAAAQDAELIDDATLSAGSRALVSLGLRRDDDERRRAMELLAQRLDARVRSATEQIITLYGLEGSATETILRRVQQTYTTEAPIDEGRAALFGGVLSGALAGLKADLATGGLSMGAGLLVGAVLGGLGGAGIARGINRLTGTKRARLSWPDAFLDGLTCAAVLRYLAIAHYGRGRGRFVEGESPAFWYEAVQAALRPRIEELHRLWGEARDSLGPAECIPALRDELHEVTAAVLLRLYPAAAAIFRQTAAQPLASTLAGDVSH